MLETKNENLGKWTQDVVRNRFLRTVTDHSRPAATLRKRAATLSI